jgi:hypothetical protein
VIVCDETTSGRGVFGEQSVDPGEVGACAPKQLDVLFRHQRPHQIMGLARAFDIVLEAPKDRRRCGLAARLVAKMSF